MFIALGAPVVVLAVITAVAPADALFIPIIILSILSYLWMLAPGIWIIRKAW